MQRGFGSDNHSGVHPQIMQSLIEANNLHTPSYGTDPWSQRVNQIFKKHFGQQAEVFFVFNGTAANVTSLRALAKNYQGVFCSDVAHLNVDECGAPEFLAGVKLHPIPSCDGKISVQELEKLYIRRGDQHYSQGQVLSLTQPTELGTVYSVQEMTELINWAKSKKMGVHVDGSRLANAAVYLKKSFSEITMDLGVDIVSLGGTKNALMMGEAVVILTPDLAKDFKYIRKQSCQLPSKSRFIACQFETYLKQDLWRQIASHAHAKALELYEMFLHVPEIKVRTQPQSNAVFATLPASWIKPLRESYFFYVWNEHSFECRFMTSWDTQSEDIRGLEQKIKELRK